ncbi:hypothetical protein ACWCW2_17190 [Streptomyces sp. NPDC001773]
MTTPGPRPDRRYAELVGGPLDGLLLEITSWTPDKSDNSVALAAELGQFGSGGRPLSRPRPGDRGHSDRIGDTP